MGKLRSTSLDVIPDNSKRLAFLLGNLFHPAVLAMATLGLVLNDLPLSQALPWMLLVGVVVLMPGMAVVALLSRKKRFTYQRSSRGPIYLTAWLSVLACLGLLLVLKAPRELVLCLATLTLWLPAQLLINRYFTKISTHSGVAAGCATGLLLLGKLNTLPLQLVVVAIVLLTSWARIRTRNHTPFQVLLGLVVGTGAALIVLPILL